MSNLNVIKASAGSGKTYALTAFYLRILLREEPDYFHGILAVTFTNKATDEMKDRIIRELFLLADNRPSGHLPDLMKVTNFSEEHLRSKASAILQRILHGYSWFSVETIDSFFQRIIRAFTRELAISGNYKIEIETEPVLQYAIDNLLDSLEPGSKLLNWLVQFSQDKIDEGRTWDIKKDLITLGSEIFKEDFTQHASTVFSLLRDRGMLNQFRNELHSITGSIVKNISALGEKSLDVIKDHGLEIHDFYYSTRGPVPFFHKVAAGNMELPNNYVLKLLDDAENWPGSKSDRKGEVVTLARETLLPLLAQIIRFISENSERYFTAREIQRRLYALGILADINEKITQYRGEKNAFILNDAPGFIYKIIDDNDAPFIYEKMGNRYKHFMLDEFQDTSVLQWSNFKPLLSNSLSMGNDCLLVGDVKQSIYRWRNSNWEILGSAIDREFSSGIIQADKLDTNWRSAEKIVAFNNAIFPLAARILHQQFTTADDHGMTSSTGNELLGMYSDIQQKVPEKNRDKGWVNTRFFSNRIVKEDPQYYVDPLLKIINQLLKSGYYPGEIAVLVRNKKEGKTIVDLLIESNDKGLFHSPVSVISNESLFLEASPAVNLLVAAMRYLVLPGDDINRGKLIILYQLIHSNESGKSDMEIKVEQGTTAAQNVYQVLPEEFRDQLSVLISLPLYELTERLISLLGIDRVKNELAYINSFLDLVHDYTGNNPADMVRFLEYWEKEGVTKSVSSSGSQDAIRVLTIHKSKGLEFPAVIIPFCDWKIDQNNTIMWVPARSEKFKYLPVYPVNYGKHLENTEFSTYYWSEKYKSTIDNINLLYVAMTRAESALIVFPVHSNGEKSNDQVSTVGDLLYQSFQQITDEEIESCFDMEKCVFEWGKLMAERPEKSLAKVLNIQNVNATAASERLFFDPKGYEFFKDQLEQRPDMRKKGKTLHTVLARIRSAGELDRSLSQAAYEGLITEDERTELKKHVKDSFSDPVINSWFDGSGEVIIETDILIGGYETRRPDRVVLFDDHVAVIDYKTGSDLHVEEHRKQVREYLGLMEKMGYKNPKGYLWYINSNKVVEI